MAAQTVEDILQSVDVLGEMERWRLFSAISGRVAGSSMRSARTLLSTLEPASAVDPQERVRRLRDEWGA